MAFDVFVSYASKDKTVADAVCARLESSGIRCWIAPRDIVAGTSYGEAIIDAIHLAKVMVLVFSSNANASGHIPKEVERAVSNGVAILPFRIEDVAPGKSLDYFIGSVHWLDAMTPPLEKHLDDLAATVHKLLPASAERQGVPVAPVSRIWQSSGTGNGPAAPPAPRTTPAAGSSSAAAASSTKTLGIAAAAVIALAVVVGAVMLLRGGGPSQGSGNQPVSTNPPGGRDLPVGNNPPPDTVDRGSVDRGSHKKPVTVRTPETAPPTPAVSATDPIVGCYRWFNNAPVVIHADGTVIGGPFTGHWRVVNASRHAYTFTWPAATDTVTVAPDQRSLSGGNQYGYPTSGTRMSGSAGIVGAWRWANGWTVTMLSNGELSAATFRGRWQPIDASRGMYKLIWPGPVDSVTLAGNGSSVSGANQYGIAISGVRTQPCAD